MQLTLSVDIITFSDLYGLSYVISIILQLQMPAGGSDVERS